MLDLVLNMILNWKIHIQIEANSASPEMILPKSIFQKHSQTRSMGVCLFSRLRYKIWIKKSWKLGGLLHSKQQHTYF